MNISVRTVAGLILKLVPELVAEPGPELVRKNMKMTFYVRLGVKIK